MQVKLQLETASRKQITYRAISMEISVLVIVPSFNVLFLKIASNPSIQSQMFKVAEVTALYTCHFCHVIDMIYMAINHSQLTFRVIDL